MSLIQFSSPSSTPTRMPGLPFELLAQIIKEARREDLPAVHQTSRVFREIARPLLFRKMTVALSFGMAGSLLSIAGTESLAHLVRVVQVSVGDSTYLHSVHGHEILNIIAVAISLLPKLKTLKIDEDRFVDAPLVFNGLLEQAILCHPSLQDLSYGRWYSPLTPYDLSFERPRSHPLTIDEIKYPQTDLVEGRDGVLPPHQFYNSIISFISNHHLHVRSLHLSSLQEDGFPLPLLLETPIPSLASFSITSSSTIPSPHLLTETDWLSLFLEKHPLLHGLEFKYDSWSDESELVRLPWRAFSFVEGLEGMSSNATIPWDALGPMASIVVVFKERQDKRNVVGLTMERCEDGWARTPSLTTLAVKGLALAFPNLEELHIRGCFDTPELTQTIASFAGFKFLQSLTFPSSLHLPIDSMLDPCEAFAFLEQLELDEEEPFLSLPRGSSKLGEEPWRYPLTEADRNDLRDLLFNSGLLGGTTVGSLVAPFDDDWRKLVDVASPSLEVLKWEVYAMDRSQASLDSTRSSWETSSWIFDRRKLRFNVCTCEGRDLEEYEVPFWIDALMRWQRPPLFEQQPDFVPAFTLDRFFTSST